MDSPTSPDRIERLLAHREWVRHLARSLVLDDSRAADLEQQVWLAALERPPRHLDAPRGWLATALRHAAWNLRRGESRRGHHEGQAARPEAEAATVDLVAEAETQRRVVDAVLGLEEPYRSTVLLRWFDDLPPGEIARRQGVPVETVRTRLKRALEQLRGRLDGEFGGDRRSWALALLPLARRADVVASTSSEIAGGLLMTVKAKAGIAIAALALLCLIGWVSFGGLRASRPSPVASRKLPDEPAPAVARGALPTDASSQVLPAATTPSPKPPERSSSGTLVIRLLDQRSGKHVAGFKVAIQGKGCGVVQKGAEGDALEQVLELSAGASDEAVSVTLLSPVEMSREVLLPAGGRVEIEFAWRPEPEIRGRVLGADGVPLEGAVVFLGEQVLARGDEPFKPFDERRVPQAVRTGATGEFVIRGEGRVVSVWHPGHSPVTVQASDCAEVRLQPRGAIKGRLVDASGAPTPGVEVTLDRTRKATTDAEGRFGFEAVEAGVRGLLMPGKRYVAVRVAPGEEEEIQVGPGLPEVRIEIRASGRSLMESLRGILIGLDRLGSQHEVKAAEGVCTVTGVIPGRFLLLTDAGHVANLEIHGPSVTVDLGQATLDVWGAAGTSVCLAPVTSDPLVDLFAMRVCHRPIPKTGGLSFSGLSDGSYRLLIEEPAGSGHMSAARTVTIVDGKDATLDLEGK